MNKIKNIPESIGLDDDGVFCLSIARAWLDVFPATLRKHARFNTDHLHLAMESKQISAYGLLSGAYIGFAPLPTSYGRFITQADRINKLEMDALPPEFRKKADARENSAASEYGMSRGELKRLLEHLDALASKCAGVASYDAIFNCKEEILQDQSAFAPADRETYAKGPLHLWDLAKAVTEKNLVDMSFGTLGDWVLFLHLEEGVVSGHAIHSSAHRFGNFSSNPLIDDFELRMRGDSISPIIEVTEEVRAAVMALADRDFPDLPFTFVPPPMMYRGTVVPTKLIAPDLRRYWAEV